MSVPIDENVSTDNTEVSTEVEPGTTEVAQETPPAGNPAWDKLRSELDPISFSRIEPHLKEWDTNFQKTLEERLPLKDYSWAKELKDAGRDPAYITSALALADMADQTPEVLYEKIGEFLTANGRMPSKQETEALAAGADPESPALDPNAEEDPKYAALAKQVSDLQAIIDQQGQEQTQAEAQRQADEELQQEVDQVKEAHPNFDDDDLGEIIFRAALKAEKTGKNVDLEATAVEYQAFLDRKVSTATPRPGDSAPTLVPTSGGVPPNPQQRKLSEMSNAETVDLVASMLAQQNAAGQS